MGAPPEVVARLAAARQEFEARQRSSVTCRDGSKDPELDQFMVILKSFIFFPLPTCYVVCLINLIG